MDERTRRVVSLSDNSLKRLDEFHKRTSIEQGFVLDEALSHFFDTAGQKGFEKLGNLWGKHVIEQIADASKENSKPVQLPLKVGKEHKQVPAK